MGLIRLILGMTPQGARESQNSNNNFLNSDKISASEKNVTVETLTNGKLTHMPTAADLGVFSHVKVLQWAHSTSSAHTTETQTITLGFSPKFVRIKAVLGIANGSNYDSDGMYDGTTQLASYKYGDGSTPPNISLGKIVYMHSGSSSNYAIIAFTATGFTLTWSAEYTLPAADIRMLIEALG